MAAPVIKTIPIKHCNFEAKVKTAGNGPPLLYLHAAAGPIWDDFVEGLTERYTVYAPHHPGTGETVRESKRERLRSQPQPIHLRRASVAECSRCRGRAGATSSPTRSTMGRLSCPFRFALISVGSLEPPYEGHCVKRVTRECDSATRIRGIGKRT